MNDFALTAATAYAEAAQSTRQQVQRRLTEELDEVNDCLAKAIEAEHADDNNRISGYFDLAAHHMIAVAVLARRNAQMHVNGSCDGKG